MSFKLQFHLIKWFQAVGTGNIVIRTLTSETLAESVGQFHALSQEILAVAKYAN